MNSEKPFIKLGIKALFLVWAFPQGSHRSQLMAELLGMELEHVYLTRRQGLFSVLIKYPAQTFKTIPILLRHRPEVLFVQNPPIFGTLIVYLWSLFTGTKFIIDSHTDALLASWWAWTLPLQRFLSHRAITTIVTNDHLAQIVAAWQSSVFVLVDPPAMHLKQGSLSPDKTIFKVIMVSTASYDEPIDHVLEAARHLPQVQFYITGNFDNSPHHSHAKAKAAPNVYFTGYVSDKQFYGLLESAQVVMSLTTENYTIQSGASEALWLGRPIITSDWPLLRSYFYRGTIWVDNSAESIRQAVLTMQADLPKFEAEILVLQEERRQEWWQRANELVAMIEQSN